MTTFQLLLMLVSGMVFYRFFKQLFSDSYPKRGTDYESKTAHEQMGGISRPDKIFSKPAVPTDRLTQLHTQADEAVARGDYAEALKALGSASVLDASNTETDYKLAYAYLQTEQYIEAKEALERLLARESDHDMGHAMLANVLHQLKEDEAALEHHEQAVALDKTYAPHCFNYANTLYDLDRTKEALVWYEKALALDSTLEDARKMIKNLSE